MSAEQNDMQAVIEAARENGNPATLEINQPQAILVPEGDEIVYPDLKAWRERPTYRCDGYGHARLGSAAPPRAASPRA